MNKIERKKKKMEETNVKAVEEIVTYERDDNNDVFKHIIVNGTGYRSYPMPGGRWSKPFKE